MERLDIVQPALFATMVALARLWEACGVKPSMVIGHSQGEVAAAHIAGALSLDDAARIIALRSKAMTKIAGRGAMASVSLPTAELKELLAPYGDRISLAAINGPRTQAVSGEPEAIEELIAYCEDKGIRAKRIAVDYAAHSAQIEELKDELLEAFAPIEPHSSRVPLHSTLTGEPIDTAEMDAQYWYRNLRETVLFNPVVEQLLEQGRSHFIEISPHPVLSFGIEEAIESTEADAQAIGTLRREEDPPQRFCLSLAEAHASGVAVEWESFFERTGAKRVPLPTYPFQRKRYWLISTKAGGDLTAAGLADAEHPLLAAAIEDPSGERLTFTGRLSLATHPWLADHAVAGTVLLPGTAFLELAMHAAERAGCQEVRELALQAPLLLPAAGAVQVQVTVAQPEEDGGRRIEIHSRAAATDDEPQEWVLNAEGALAASAAAPPAPLDAWPPEGAEPLETEFLYDVLAEAGFEYGPAFQGLTRAWNRDGEIFAEVSLAEQQADEAGRFSIHPALFDAALHTILLSAMQGGFGEGPMLPFAWGGVTTFGAGPTQLRVALRRSGERRVSLVLADTDGAPLAGVESLVVRPVATEQLQSAATRRLGLLGIEWRALAPGADRSAAGEVETWRYAPAPDADPTAAVREATAAALAAIQGWLRGEQAAEGRLAIVTRGAVAVAEGEAPDPAAAAIWGLARAAQSEHPDSFVLVDSDGTDASEAALAAALSAPDENQLALREGGTLAPRATRLAPAAADPGSAGLDPDRTVLITGGTGTLGGLVAKHLVETHGARRLLLLSRSGAKAPGAAELLTELAELGAKAKIAACDVADEEQLRAVLEKIPKTRPLGAVFHAAAALDDATIDSLTPERFEAVLAPKADAAWTLHRLTADADLSQFVIFSSVAGVLGGPGQGNYAAANAFCDALAARRRAEGLPGTSIAWGHWEAASALTEKLDEAALERMRSGGVAPLSTEDGLELLDRSLVTERAAVIAMGIEPAGLRALASLGILPPLLRELVRMPRREAVAAGSFARQLAEMPEEERDAAVLELVRSQVASVLGVESAAGVDPDRAFQELGLDSLAALELRNRLAIGLEMKLPPTLIFDYPNAAALAAFLVAKVAPGESPDGATAEEREVRDLLASIPVSRLRSTGLLDSLVQLAAADDEQDAGEPDEDHIDAMDVEELILESIDGGADADGMAAEPADGGPDA
jgi:malonyl CoA-acyl carrier protein transacylase/NADP-dependent 3-hydroxy acid dehydrogenase YdfG/acyl carrier protein